MIRLTLALLLLCGIALAQSSPCSAPEYHQLDFWIGNWDVYDPGATKPDSHVKVTRILGGCALHEEYSDDSGHRGESFSMYDAGQKKWRQSWYTNRGKSLELLGGAQGDSIVLEATDYQSTPQSLVRGTWKPMNGNVQETAVISKDGGKTWTTWFDLSFRPAKTDEQTILQLDSEFQNAVKHNDVTTLDRIVAENYVLKSSLGNTYNKADLLAEARSGRYVYEIQDDSEQSVHIWGDTAVITAKLHAKGTEDGKPFDYTLTFTDTYARTPSGWKYVFAQAGCRK